MIRIALPNKGRLFSDIQMLFEEAGLPFQGSDRSLTASLGPYKALFVRAKDIPELLAKGVAEVGITGLDCVRESACTLEELLDLQFGACRVVLAASGTSGIHSLEELRLLPSLRVATVFPTLARGFFEAHKIQATLVPVSGACEIAPYLGIAEVIVDLVSTGSTLRANRLVELDTVLQSTARLFASPDTHEHPEVLSLSSRLASVIRARSQRYLMANVPRDRLDEVRACLPGLNGPSVCELVPQGLFVALHAVVAAETVDSTLASLKSLGCEGILVTRMERLMP